MADEVLKSQIFREALRGVGLDEQVEVSQLFSQLQLRQLVDFLSSQMIEKGVEGEKLNQFGLAADSLIGELSEKIEWNSENS